MELLTFSDSGIYCAAGDFYIDPWKKVAKAIITHGHSDHARAGSAAYLCHNDTVPILKLRLGIDINVRGVAYGETIFMNGVKLSLYPAGHILGSAQVRVEYKGEVWVVSGDYKLEHDPMTLPFEPLKCHTFITESTFGLPVFDWKPTTDIITEIEDWYLQNKANGICSVLCAYSLGKAQRILQLLSYKVDKVYTHGAIENVHTAIKQSGIQLKSTLQVLPGIPKSEFQGALVLAPPAAAGSAWMKRFGDYSLGIASGWMRLRGARRRKAADRGFVLSDHADWKGLLSAVKGTGAQRVIVTHGYTEIFAKYLREQGLDAQAVKTAYEGEVLESAIADGVDENLLTNA